VLCMTVWGAAYLGSVQQHNQSFSQLGDALAGKIGQEANLSDRVRLSETLSYAAPDGALVQNLEGEALAGQLPEDRREAARTFSVLQDQTEVARLILVPPIHRYNLLQGLIPLIIMSFSALVAFCVWLFSARLVTYIRKFTQEITAFRPETGLTSQAHALLDLDVPFSEFNLFRDSIKATARQIQDQVTGLQMDSLIDSRTGLSNEKALTERLTQLLERVTYDHPAILITFELSMVTDHLERQYVSLPERAYEEAALRLQDFVKCNLEKRDLAPDHWFLSSLAGDQFSLLVMSEGVNDELSVIIRDLQMAFTQPLVADRQSFTIKAVGSVLRLPEDGVSAAQLRRRSNATLYDLKAQGKSEFAFYSARLERQRDARIKLESELREAVEQDRFVPLYQPKIDLRTGEIYGVEALARWQLDNGRLVSPAVFIDLAEQTGIINDIGEQIMRKACQQAAEWQQEGFRLGLAVNVSPRQFEQNTLSDMIIDSLATSGLSPRQLEIEITESVAIQHHEKVSAVLKPLRQMGVKLAVDDFGTGHSNLSVLTQISFDVFKIDRQFVTGTPTDPQANAIVQMILGMANTLNMQIVGEGIEIPEQAEFLRQQGCHIGQGYLYSPPVKADEIRKMLTERPFEKKRKSA